MADQTTAQLFINKLPEILIALVSVISAIVGLITYLRTGKINQQQAALQTQQDAAQVTAEKTQRGVTSAIQASARNAASISEVKTAVAEVHDTTNGKMQEIIEMTGVAAAAVATLAERDRAAGVQPEGQGQGQAPAPDALREEPA